LGIGTSMKRTGVNSTVAAIGRQELREGASHVVADESGDYIFFAIRDDEVVTSVRLHPVFNPARSWVDTWLRACRAGGLPFSISFPSLVQSLLCCKFVIEYHCHTLVVKGGHASHGLMRGRNGKWLRAGRRAVWKRWVGVICKFGARVCRECIRNGNVTRRRRNVDGKK